MTYDDHILAVATAEVAVIAAQRREKEAREATLEAERLQDAAHKAFRDFNRENLVATIDAAQAS